MKITLADAPAIAGLTFRSFAGEADYHLMAEIAKLDMSADRSTVTLSPAELAFAFSPGERYDPYSQLVIAEVDGRGVAYASVYSAPLQDGSQLYGVLGAVIPAWRRRGLGSALLHHIEGIARRLARQKELVGPHFFQAFVSDTAVGTGALLTQEGYLPVRYGYDMIRPHLEEIPEAHLPPGVEVRAVLPEHYRSIWEADQENFAEHWGRTVPSKDAYERWLSNPLFDPSLWRIAWADDEVVGQVRSVIIADENEVMGRLRGYTEDISVRRDWRRQGLARALLCQSLHALKAAGMTEAALGVDTENANRALQLYESCGFVVERSETVYRKPMIVS